MRESLVLTDRAHGYVWVTAPTLIHLLSHMCFTTRWRKRVWNKIRICANRPHTYLSLGSHIPQESWHHLYQSINNYLLYLHPSNHVSSQNKRTWCSCHARPSLLPPLPCHALNLCLSPPASARPVLSHENVSLINPACTLIDLVILTVIPYCVCKKNPVSPVTSIIEVC